MNYYLSIQFSAIQKVVLRHDRLWSIAGTSHILSRLNEIEMKKVIKNHSGRVILASGGKLTASFPSNKDAEEAKEGIRALISTRLPMLEYQVSSVIDAESFKEAQKKDFHEDKDYPGITRELKEIKRCFRGYGVTFNPHLALCEECEEYPLESDLKVSKKGVCRICNQSWKAARINLGELLKKDENDMTSIEKIYLKYTRVLSKKDNLEVPLNMEDLFPEDKSENKPENKPEDKNGKEKEKERKRIAVWSSDVNSMGDRLPLWISQEEGDIQKTFDKLKDFIIDVLSETLKKVFTEETLIKKNDGIIYIPFRLIVAGGDDLFIVMPHRFIVDFALTYSRIMSEKAVNISEYSDTLTKTWLEKKAKEEEKDGKKKNLEFSDLSFAGSFIVTHIHTPFTRIHAIGEDLMSTAKKKTDRKVNSINWRILSVDEETPTEDILKTERPLGIEKPYNGFLTFDKYVELCKEFSNLSNSHIHQIVRKIIELNGNSGALERWLYTLPEAGKNDSGIKKLLAHTELKDNNDKVDIKRIVTLFELINLMRG